MDQKSALLLLFFVDSLVYSNGQDSRNKNFFLHQIGKRIAFSSHTHLNLDTLHIVYDDDVFSTIYFNHFRYRFFLHLDYWTIIKFSWFVLYQCSSNLSS